MASDLLHVSHHAGKSRRAGMLRITIHENPKDRTIQLEGKIAGAWVEEFNRTWHSVATSLGSKQLHFDLRGVAFVDAKGRELLREIYQKAKPRFLTDSPLTRYFADDAMQQSSKNG